MKKQMTEQRRKIRIKYPRIRVERALRESRREQTIPGRTATITILKRRPVRALLGLRKEWENNRPWRHVQATGFLLGEMARNLQWTAFTFLPIVSRFIERRGPYGVDGIWLSAVSLAQRINPSGFQDAIALADEISGTVNLPHDDRFGMYFFDLGMAVSSLSLPSFADTTGLGIRTGGTVSSGIAGLSSAFSDTRPVMMSAFPDSARGPMFNDRGIGDAANVGGGFGVGVRATGRDSLLAQSPQAQQSLYGGYTNKVLSCIGSNLGDSVPRTGENPTPGEKFVTMVVCGVQVAFETDAASARVAADNANAWAADDRAAADAAEIEAADSAAAADAVDASVDPEAAAEANEKATADAAKAAEAKADAEVQEAEAAKAEAKAKAAEKAKAAKGTDEDPNEAGVVEDPDAEDTYPAPEGTNDGSAGIAALNALGNLSPYTQPPSEDLGGGNQMLHFPSSYFDEQIQTREGAESSSNAMELLARLRDLIPLINPGS